MTKRNRCTYLGRKRNAVWKEGRLRSPSEHNLVLGEPTFWFKRQENYELRFNTSSLQKMEVVARMSRLPTQTPRPNSYRQKRLCIMISYVLKSLAVFLLLFKTYIYWNQMFCMFSLSRCVNTPPLLKSSLLFCFVVGISRDCRSAGRCITEDRNHRH